MRQTVYQKQRHGRTFEMTITTEDYTRFDWALTDGYSNKVHAAGKAPSAEAARLDMHLAYNALLHSLRED